MRTTNEDLIGGQSSMNDVIHPLHHGKIQALISGHSITNSRVYNHGHVPLLTVKLLTTFLRKSAVIPIIEVPVWSDHSTLSPVYLPVEVTMGRCLFVWRWTNGGYRRNLSISVSTALC